MSPLTDQELADAGLLLHIDGPVATITLNRPDVRNAQRPRMWAGLARVLDGLGPEVRVVVLRGAGGTFSAGLDLSLMDPAQAEEEGNLLTTLARSDQEIADQIGEYQRPFLLLASPRYITIAVVEGHAIGAGFQLALACDLRITTQDARFCMKEPALGLVPDLLGTKTLPLAVGYARALEITASGRTVDGIEAERIGLALAAVPPSELDATVSATAAALTTHVHGAITATKDLLQRAREHSLEEHGLAERTAQVARFRALTAH